MSNRIIGMSLQGDLSYWLRQLPKSEDGRALNFGVWLFSGLFGHADLKFQYRLGDGLDWLDDASIVSDNATFSSGNTMLAMPCSISGAYSTFKWRHLDNKIDFGSTCEVRLSVMPAPIEFSQCLDFTYIEAMAGAQDRVMEDKINAKVVGRDYGGNLLSLTSSSFILLNQSHKPILSVSGLSNPSHAQGMVNGHYIILDAGNDRIIEIDSFGAFMFTSNIAAIASNSPYFWYDESSRTLFLSGGAVPKVYELSWSMFDYGTVLWSHGQPVPGSGLNQLNGPNGVVRHYGAGDVVLIADQGNTRIIVVDRSPVTGSISAVTDVSFNGGDAVVGVYDPMRVLSAGGMMHIVEGVGEPEAFNIDRKNHPTIVRALSDHEDPQRKDEMVEYGNILFKPVIRPLEDENG